VRQIAATALRIRTAIDLMKNPGAFRMLCKDFGSPGYPGVQNDLANWFMTGHCVNNSDCMAASWTKFPLLSVRPLSVWLLTSVVSC
jgi:hypothetical protein